MVCPTQIVLGVAKAFTVGSGFTITDIEAVFEHPFASVPVTE
jgi:hypothetical protein